MAGVWILILSYLLYRDELAASRESERAPLPRIG
jgi:hypothetical protein